MDNDSHPVIGINFEGGKIAEYAEALADESVRCMGRSELSMQGYCESSLLSSLDAIIATIKKFGNERLTIIQIARGRSSADTISLLLPILEKHNLNRYQIFKGYKSCDYFAHPEEEFVFLNIGMFGRLTDTETIFPGQVLSPSLSFDLTSTLSGSESQLHSVVFKQCHPRYHNTKNLWSSVASDHTGIYFVLLGIEDDMPFVTPETYDEKEILRVIERVNNVNIN